jgi:hypothetical protein
VVRGDIMIRSAKLSDYPERGLVLRRTATVGKPTRLPGQRSPGANACRTACRPALVRAR